MMTSAVILTLIGVVLTIGFVALTWLLVSATNEMFYSKGVDDV